MFFIWFKLQININEVDFSKYLSTIKYLIILREYFTKQKIKHNPFLNSRASDF